MAMPPVELDYLAIVVAAAAYFVLGGLWYGLLFARPWMRAMGWAPDRQMTDEEKRRAMPGYVVSLVGALVAVTVLAMLVDYAGATDWMAGASLGLLAGVAFSLSTSAPSMFFEGRSRTLWMINEAYNLTALVIAGVVLALWQ
ncbi:MAG: DUF1761 domain-containing protein [Candidatus Rokuibacteriota bacterium]